MSDSRTFRDILGRYPTGVTIVSAFVRGEPLGVTVNSFASVSLDPPLVLWSIERATERYTLFREIETFAINILASDQADLAHACALSPDLRACRASWSGETAPLLDGAIAQLTCRQAHVYAGGDHDIIVGEVTAMAAPRDAKALTFYRGRYGQPG